MNNPISIREFILKNWFSRLFLIFVLIGAIPLFFFQKGDIVFIINNKIANTNLDIFFTYYTDTALGFIFVFAILIALCFSYKKATIIASLGIIIFILSIICKQLLFADFPRPTAMFPLEPFHHLIPNFEYAKKFSFPSGHSMTAFSITTIISYYSKSQLINVILFIYAISIAFSRMYLLQHFFIDVYIGAIIGYCAVLVILYFYPYFKKIPERGLF